MYSFVDKVILAKTNKHQIINVYQLHQTNKFFFDKFSRMPCSINVCSIDSRTQSSYSINNSLCPQICPQQCPRTTNDNNIKTTTIPITKNLHIYLHIHIFDHLPKVSKFIISRPKTFAAFHKNLFLCKMQKHKRESERETKSDLLVFIKKEDKDLCVEKRKQQCMHNSSPQQQTQE